MNMRLPVAETTHEVTMVTGGERYTIATWFHAAHGE